MSADEEMAPRADRAKAPALSVSGLKKSFGGLHVLRGLSLDIPDEPDTAVAVLGQNGAGKTTLLNLITRLLPADQGTITVYGHDVLARSAQELHTLGLARTFQSPRLLLDETAIDNVLLGVAGKGSWARGRKRHFTALAEEALDRVGLLAEAGRKASALPFGHRKMVELARSLIARPRLLLLDEPAAGLSSLEASALGEVLVSLRQSDVHLLLIEHRMELVREVARRVVMMNAGEIVFDGGLDEALASDVVRAGYLGEGFSAPIGQNEEVGS